MLSSSEVIQLSIYTDKYLYNLYFPFTFQTTLRYDDIKYDANICKGESFMAYHGVETAKFYHHRENIQYPLF